MTTMKSQSEPIYSFELEGWKKQFIASEPRLTEAKKIYKDIGLEVKIVSLPKVQECEIHATGENESEGECQVCFKGFENQYKIIYTRPAREDTKQ